MRSVGVCLALAAVLMLSCSFVFAGGSAEEGEAAADMSIEDFSGKTIGVQTGSIFDKMIAEAMPDAKIAYFSTFTDEINALKAKKSTGYAVLKRL